MFVRATLAFAVIAMLLPHAFDPGRPASLAPPDAGSALQACVTLGGSEAACRAALPTAPQGDLQGFVFDRLRAVKADMAARPSVLAQNSVGDERGDAAPAVPPASSR
jgi:hypothetical protein